MPEVGMRRLYFLIVSIVLTIFSSNTIYADTTYIIKKGDTPQKIAKKFKVSSRDIVKVNNLKPCNLKTGMSITIPLGKKDVSRKNNPAEKKDKKTIDTSDIKTENSHEDSSVHIIKKGDTLFSLSKKYSVPITELKDINKLESNNLTPGQKLIVGKSGQRTYTVKRGDTIYQITRRFNIKLNELRKINSLETDKLKPGQTILLEEPSRSEEEPKTYDTIIAQAPAENTMENNMEMASGSPELMDIGIQDRLILFAKKLLDIPYRFGGNSLLGIDCSAYVQKVYGIIGVNLPRSAREQFTEGNSVEKEELSMGDLVFFKTYASFPSHVGIYLGNNLFIHASSRSKKVTIDSLETPYYLKRFIGGKRVIEGAYLKDDSQQQS